MKIETLKENTKDKVQKVDTNLDKNKATKSGFTASTKSKKEDQHKLSLDTMVSNTQCSKREKKVPKCPSMSIDDFIELQRSKDKAAATKSFNGKTPGSSHPSSNQPLKVNENLPTRQEEVIEDFAQIEGDINDEQEVTNTIREEEKEGGN